jgi:hypothetical protein
MNTIHNRLPFEESNTHSIRMQYAQELVNILDLPKDIRFVEGDSKVGLDHERRFRIMWWMTGNEPLRMALYHSKMLIYRQCGDSQSDERLTGALRNIEQTLQSLSWRNHLHNLVQKTDLSGKLYLRLFFRAAQQIWSRAARWHAIMPMDIPSPFIPFLKLMSIGAWPLGCHNDSLWVFILNEKIKNTVDFGPPTPIPQQTIPINYIFLSSLFDNLELITKWREYFHDKGWNTLHGPVCEDVFPPEIQLGKQIQKAGAVVGLLQKSDPDFGIPWWMYQELDYALFCQRPVGLISQFDNTDPELPDLNKFNYSLEDIHISMENHELWDWLRTNTHNYGGK